MLFFLILATLLSSVNAVLVSTFDNCLKEFSKRSPAQIQFHPILVAAEFHAVAEGESYLYITVYGAVTGKSTASPAGKRKREISAGGFELSLGEGEERWGSMENLEDVGAELHARALGGMTGGPNEDQPAEATHFGRGFDTTGRWPREHIYYNFTGAIVDFDDAWTAGGTKPKVATTLSTTITMSSFHVSSNKTFLCEEGNHPSSVMAKCPLGDLSSAGDLPDGELSYDELKLRRIPPKDKRNDIDFLVKELPSFTFKRRLTSDHQFGTLSILLRLISGDPGSTTIGCVRVQVTPALTEGNNLALTWVSAGVLMLVGLAGILAAMFNPWNGTTDIFKWSSNFGMDVDMIRLVTPGFADCLQWLQFIVLTGGLSINYPTFYPAAVSRVAWSALLVNTSFSSDPDGTQDPWRADGLYAQQAWKYGYERLAQLVGLYSTEDIWACVMVWFTVLLCGSVIVFQIYFWGRWLMRKATGVEEEDLTNNNWPFTAGRGSQRRSVGVIDVD